MTRISVINYILAGFAVFMAADITARMIYRTVFVDGSMSKLEIFRPQRFVFDQSRPVFKKEEGKEAARTDPLYFTAGIKLSGVFHHPDEPAKSSAVFVLGGKESVLKRTGEEITGGVILDQIGEMEVIIREGSEEFRLTVESDALDEPQGRLVIKNESSPPSEAVGGREAKSPPGVITSDPDQKIVKPVPR